MEIIAEYRQLTKGIAVLNSRIKSKERELSKLTLTYAPRDIGGIDYSDPCVQTSLHHPDIVQVASKIYDLNKELKILRDELKEIMNQRDELDKCIDSLGDTKSKIMMLKIKGYTNRQISWELNYSKRHIERIVKESYEKLKKMAI